VGIRTSLAKWLNKDYQLGTPQGMGNGLQIFNMQLPPGWGYQSYLKAYGEIGTLFACVNVIAQAVAKVQWHLYELDPDGERTEIFKHPLIDLLNHINPFQSRYQFMYLGTQYKLLVGEEFWQINFNGGNLPGEMWLAPPAFMSVIPHPTKYIDHYEFRRTGMAAPVNFTVEEIIHIKTPNPYNEYRGLSPAQALTTDLDSERYASKYQQKLFFNDATPGFVLEYPAENMPPMESRKELMQEWDERFKGFRNRGKTAFLFGAKANVLTMSNKDMDFATLRAFNRDSIMAAYHVPRSKLGITESVNRANAEQGDYDFNMNCVHPELCEIRESLNKELTVFYGANLYLDFDNPIPEDEVANINKAINIYKAGLITKDEARATLNLDPVEDGTGAEYFSAPQSGFGATSPLDMPLNLPVPSELPAKALIGGPEHPKGIFADDAAKEAHWRSYVQRVEPYEAPLIKALKAMFASQQQEAIGNVRRATSASYDLVSRPAFQAAYITAAEPTLKALVVESVKQGYNLVAPEIPHKGPPKLPVNWDVVNQLALQWLKTRMGWAAQQVGEETAKKLAEALRVGFAAGESMDDIADRVSEVFDMTDMRAERIARTETIAASNRGALEGYRATGIVDRTQWYTALDEPVCDICQELHGQVSPIGEGVIPPAHPRCRCTTLPWMVGETPTNVPETPGAFA
jgi:HK97 family phage portal protein